MILLWIPILIFVYIKMIDPGKKREHPVLNVNTMHIVDFMGKKAFQKIPWLLLRKPRN